MFWYLVSVSDSDNFIRILILMDFVLIGGYYSTDEWKFLIHLPLCVYIQNAGPNLNLGDMTGVCMSFLLCRVTRLTVVWCGVCDRGHRKQRAAGFPPFMLFGLISSPASRPLLSCHHLIEGQSWVDILDPRTHMSRVFIWAHKDDSVFQRTWT